MLLLPLLLKGDKGPTKVKFTFRETPAPELLDLSSLLYDIELLHDLLVIVAGEKYADYRFSPAFWNRKGRPLTADDRLRVSSVDLHSPLEVTLVFAGVGAVWCFIQIIEKVSNWGLNKEKLRLEVMKLRAEVGPKQIAEEDARAQLKSEIDNRQASVFADNILRRLGQNSIGLQDIEIFPSSVEHPNRRREDS